MRVGVIPYIYFNGDYYILLCEEGLSNKLNVIGGQLDKGETPEEGISRETFEETIGILNLSPNIFKSLPENHIKINKNEINYFIKMKSNSKKVWNIPEEYKKRRHVLSKIGNGTIVKFLNSTIIKSPVYEELNGLFWIKVTELPTECINSRVRTSFNWFKKQRFVS
jgi:hypothetical protein